MKPPACKNKLSPDKKAFIIVAAGESHEKFQICTQPRDVRPQSLFSEEEELMGLLSDIFISDPNDALAYGDVNAKNKINSDRYQSVKFKRLTNLEFSTLWAIIKNEEWDISKHDLEMMSDMGESWIFKFPDAFIADLASLDEKSITKFADLWAKTEELQWKPSETKEVIAEVVKLANLVKNSPKSLYLWVSL
jgi:hypothetical protein